MNMEQEIEKINLNLKENPKILIIGAGISGIAAGEFLARSGFSDFKILEASNRTGGRIWTVDVDGNGHKAEMGANWIHGVEKNPIFKIADDNGFLELRHGDKGLRHRNVFLTEDGEEIGEKVINQVNLVYGKLILQAEDFYNSEIPADEDDSVGAFLEREFEESLEKYTNGDRRIRKLVFDQRRLLECCISGCDRLEDVSLGEFGGYEELPGVHYTIPPGFEKVLEILKGKIPKENILLNHPVKCVHWNRKNSGDNQYKVMVECENGELFYANHVIVTVSLGVLKAAYDRMFDPPLPPSKVEAIDRLGFGIVDKVILQFDEPVTKSDIFRVELLWDNQRVEKKDLRKTWFRKIYSFEVLHGNVIVGWLSGKEALFMESLSEEQIAEDLVEVLKMFLKKKDIPKPKIVVRTRWGNDIHTRGSYSFIKVGSSMGDVELLAESLTGSESKKPQVLFGGEATHDRFYSTTHGALLSGRREAEKVVKMYS